MFSRPKRDDINHEENAQKKEYLIYEQHKVILNSRGLVPVILQELHTKEILHLGFMNRWALDISFSSKYVYLYRRSTGKIQLFGESKNQVCNIKTAKLDRYSRSIMLQVLVTGKDPSEGITLPTSSFVQDVKLI